MRVVREAGFVNIEVVDCREGVWRSLRRQRRIGYLALAAITVARRGTAGERRRLRADIRQWRPFRAGAWTIVTLIATRAPDGLPEVSTPADGVMDTRSTTPVSDVTRGRGTLTTRDLDAFFRNAHRPPTPPDLSEFEWDAIVAAHASLYLKLSS